MKNRYKPLNKKTNDKLSKIDFHKIDVSTRVNLKSYQQVVETTYGSQSQVSVLRNITKLEISSSDK